VLTGSRLLADGQLPDPFRALFGPPPPPTLSVLIGVRLEDVGSRGGLLGETPSEGVIAGMGFKVGVGKLGPVKLFWLFLKKFSI